MQGLRFYNNSDILTSRATKVQNFLDGHFIDPMSNEPTFLTFEIDFDYSNAFDESLGMYMSPLLGLAANTGSGINSAEAYIRSRNNGALTGRFLSFKTILKKIFGGIDDSSTQNNYAGMPWMIQSMDGIPAMWKAGVSGMKTGDKAKDVVIRFETLESLNLLVTAMADYYNQSVYDQHYMREILPRNLRYFRMNIYVGEFRNLYMLAGRYADNVDPTGMTASDATLSNQRVTYFDDYASFMKYTCSLCEFDFSDATAAEATLSSHTPNMAKNKFAIKVGWFEANPVYMTDAVMPSMLPSDPITISTPPDNTHQNLLQSMAKRAKDAAYGLWQNSATRGMAVSTGSQFKQAIGGPGGTDEQYSLPPAGKLSSTPSGPSNITDDMY